MLGLPITHKLNTLSEGPSVWVKTAGPFKVTIRAQNVEIAIKIGIECLSQERDVSEKIRKKLGA